METKEEGNGGRVGIRGLIRVKEGKKSKMRQKEEENDREAEDEGERKGERGGRVYH